MSILRKILERSSNVNKSVNIQKECKKLINFEFDNDLFYGIMRDKQIAGNYPVGGEIIAKIDKELYNELKKRYDIKDVKIGDCAVMNNGWSLD